MMPFERTPTVAGSCSGECREETVDTSMDSGFRRLHMWTPAAYCAMSLVETYEQWLMMSVDHVVPTRTGQVFGIPDDWLADYANIVLCCSACNGFGNRYKLMPDVVSPTNLDDFFSIRDRVFSERKKLILLSHEKERAFYEKKPWS